MRVREFKKYTSFFRVGFQTGVQYRMAACAMAVTHFLWGLMECLLYRAFLEANPSVFPMEFSAVVAYVWLREGLFTMFNVFAADNDIFQMILDGNISYELCRPILLYDMWFVRIAARRVSVTFISSVPMFVGVYLMPEPFRLAPPVNIQAAFLFFITLALGLGVTVSFCMLVYVTALFTISPQGLRTLLTSLVEILSGAIIPIPFMPEPVRKVAECLPFASMQNVPLRVYSGDLAGAAMMRAIFFQVFWFAVLLFAGKCLCGLAQKRIVVQGG